MIQIHSRIKVPSPSVEKDVGMPLTQFLSGEVEGTHSIKSKQPNTSNPVTPPMSWVSHFNTTHDIVTCVVHILHMIKKKFVKLNISL